MHENIPEWIKLDDCLHGWLYIVAARNASIGIYDKNQQAFIIRRLKGGYYLSSEYHWDSDPHSTAKPLKALEKSPTFETDQDQLNYLESKTQEYKQLIEKAGLYAG